MIDYLLSLYPLIAPYVAWYAAWSRDFLNIMHETSNVLFYIFLAVAVFVSFLFYALLIFNLLHRKPMSEKPFIVHKAPFVTIQIPTKNELAALKCAEKCLAFDYPSDRYEILIGDDSDDPLVSLQLNAFAQNNERVFVHTRPTNDEFKAGNLKNLLLHTRGDFIVVFDSDFLPPVDFLSRIIAPFQYDSQLTVVQARWKINNSNENLITVLGATVMKVFHFVTMPFIARFGKTALLCGSAEAIRKEHLLAAGGWSGRCLIEDIECSLRLHAQKRKFLYLENLECECEVPHTPLDLYKQQKRWSYGVIKSLKVHGPLLLSSKPDWKRLVCLGIFSSGYLLSSLIAGLFIFGTITFLTHPPGPLQLGVFFFETTLNVLLTSGLIAASLYAVLKDRDIKRVDKVLFSTLTYGLVVMVWVNIGIYEVITGKKLAWYIPKKKQ